MFSEKMPPSDRARQVPTAPFLTRPPADTRVLLGYVRDADHYQWIVSTSLYNMWANSRTGSVGLGSEQLAAELVALYGPELAHVSLWKVNGDPRLITRQRMLELNYPNPGSVMYYCLPVEPLVEGTEALRGLTFALVQQVVQEVAPGREYGAQVATTWERLVTFVAAHVAGRS